MKILIGLFAATLLCSGCINYKGIWLPNGLAKIPEGTNDVSVVMGDVLVEIGGAKIDKLEYK